MTPTTGNAPLIAIACGGTGGHLFPGLAVGQELLRRGCAVQLLISPKDVDQSAVKSTTGFEVITLPAVAFQSGSRLAFFRGFVKSYLAARKQFKRRTPQAALAMGGFTSVPPVLAARRLGAKTFLHESNTIPGRANRVLSRWVDVAFTGFPEAAVRLKCRCTMNTGTPVRPQFQSRDTAECRRALGLAPERSVVLVTGGSQGARGLNDLILRALPLVARTVPEWQWFHLTGAADVEHVRAAYAEHKLTAIVQPFSTQMEQALGAADAAVTRAGASSLAELAAVQLPAVLVPLPTSADDHQRFNAKVFSAGGAARWVEQTTATPEELVKHLRELIGNAPVRANMQASLARRHAPGAAAEIATQVLASLAERTVDAPSATRLEVVA
jgi:UDP-N-acetylglucosamine--N-acetylmuramyl-(pentapeptide) pyrophosphoryl-undecaprenol N-acetylglucosamine transferase